MFFFFFKQKTAYEMRISDWSSDVCSSDLWVNYNFITEDTDAMAARINAVGTEKSVKYALEAAKYVNVPGLSADTKRKLDILRNGIVLPAPTTEGAATELNRIAPALSSQYGKGKGTLDGRTEERRVGKEGVRPCRSLWDTKRK